MCHIEAAKSRLFSNRTSAKYFFVSLSRRPMSYLHGLNSAQLRAVEHDPHVPLQILAGPGSGKTKVLTSRIAHLIDHHGMKPSSICAVTFTNKAATEMRERLTKLLGKERTADIRMGTFHALCARFLRRHARLVELEENFTVCDTDESKKIVARLLKPHKEYLAVDNIVLKNETVLSHISRAKNKGQTPNALLTILEASKQALHGSKSCSADCTKHIVDGVVIQIYQDYDKSLQLSNSLDFDDLLIYGVKLFGGFGVVGRWCRHVLVDEFQDTNLMQYDLMRHIAAANRCVTIVGDPDQSIYGWRSADIENLAKMQSDFPSTKQIMLENNYRSTASIVSASLAIIAEDKTRIGKTLHTTHPKGPLPVLCDFPTERIEAASIAAEIRRLVARSGGMLGWGDFAVLLRINAHSRAIESALRLEDIPCRVLSGHKFFERIEVKDILAYLQLIDNPHFVPAFTRVINVPGRNIGEKTVTEVLATAKRHNVSPMRLAEDIYDGTTPDIKPPVRRKLASFIELVRELRTMATTCSSPSDMIRQLLTLLNYEEYLKKMQSDWESRWENVQELITFASEVERGLVSPVPVRPDPAQAARPVSDSALLSSSDVNGQDEAQEAEGASAEDTPLRLFLQASMLSTDAETENDEDAKNKVIIATCHAAKGLEWPVVMIPSVDKGTYPIPRADDIEEERRILYVACTRAQSLLYITHANSRMVAGASMKRDLSNFISAVQRSNKSLFTGKLPRMDNDDLKLIAGVLHRPVPTPAEVGRSMNDYDRPTGNSAWADNGEDKSNQQVYGRQIGDSVFGAAQSAVQFPFQASGQYAHPEQFTGVFTIWPPRDFASAGYSEHPVYDPRPLSPSRNRAANVAGPFAAQGSSQRQPSFTVPPRSDHLQQATTSRPRRAPTSSPAVLPYTLKRPVSGKARGVPIIPAFSPVPSTPSESPKGAKKAALPKAAKKRAPSEVVGVTAPTIPQPSLSSTASSRPPEPASAQAPDSRPCTRQDPLRGSAFNAQGSHAAESVGEPQTTSLVGTKRRLGMGRSSTGYQNKKFKAMRP